MMAGGQLPLMLSCLVALTLSFQPIEGASAQEVESPIPRAWPTRGPRYPGQPGWPGRPQPGPIPGTLPDFITLVVKVTDTDGRPQAFARVKRAGMIYAPSNPEGVATVLVPPTLSGVIRLEAVTVKSGFGPKKYGRAEYEIVRGRFSDTVQIVVRDIIDLVVTVSGVDPDGEDLGPISGAVVNTLDEWQYNRNGITDAEGKAFLKVVPKPGGNGGNSIRVANGGVAGFVQTSDHLGAYSYTEGQTSESANVKLVRTCRPEWNGKLVSVKKLGGNVHYVSPGGTEDFSLSFRQVQEGNGRPACTQFDSSQCDTASSFIVRMRDVGPVIQYGYVKRKFDGHIYIEVLDRAGDGGADLASRGRKDELTVYYDNMVYSPWQEKMVFKSTGFFDVRQPPLPAHTNKAKRWSVGCVDMRTKKFYCLNMLDYFDDCESVIPE